ncbi:MAG: hypothetical protein Q4G19_06500 [Clostridia bacterium]|nr:hypothetical protein [Clostridia bacterium]
MKTWLEATREDVIIEPFPGVCMTNDNMINKLNWTSWLPHMGELLSGDVNQFANTTREHFEDLTFLIHNEMVRASTGAYPEFEDAQAYMKTQEARDTIDKLTEVTVQLTRENWPAFRKLICEEVGLDPDDFQIDLESADGDDPF